MTSGDLPPLAVLAGGLATRLRPITTTIPKCLVEVAGEPFVAHQLRLFSEQGFRNVVLCVGHFEEQISDFVGDGVRFGLSVTYSSDGPERQGTGGALRNALPQLGDTFMVTYGDSYLDIDSRLVFTAFRQSGRPALITVFRNDNRWDRSNILFRSGQVLKHDKKNTTSDMLHIEYGLGCLTPGIFARWSGTNPLDLSDVYADLADRGQLAAFEVTTRFHEIGSSAGLQEADVYLRQRSRTS